MYGFIDGQEPTLTQTDKARHQCSRLFCSRTFRVTFWELSAEERLFREFIYSIVGISSPQWWDVGSENWEVAMGSRTGGDRSEGSSRK
jgi:hypothetical protein